MYDTAMSRACLISVLMLVLPLAACQSTATGKPSPDTTVAPAQTPDPKADPNPAPTAETAEPAPKSIAATANQATVDPAQQASAEPAVQPVVPPPATAETAPLEAKAELIFLDFAGFDEDLSREMTAERSTIAVDVPAAFSLNDIPDRLDRWFYRVKETGGAVKAREKVSEEERRTRGIVGALLDLAVSAIKAQEAEEMLQPASAYNVVVEYDKTTGKADRVLFYRR